jgi:hypothetical protein
VLIPLVVLAVVVVAAVVIRLNWSTVWMEEASGDMWGGPVSEPYPPWSDLDPRPCPGGTGYYNTESVTRFHHRPTAAEMKAVLSAPPPPNVGDVFACPGDCLNVLTHIWHSWYLKRARLLHRWELHVVTFAQYRCMKPDDPAAKLPAVLGHPLDPTRPVMN